MSPLEIEAYRITNLKVVGKELGNNPAVKIDEKGKESPIEPGKFVTLKEGEKLIIPDTRERVWAETDNSNFCLWRDMKPIPGAHTSVVFWTETKGCGIAREGIVEIPIARDHCTVSEGDLEKYPAVVWTEKQKLVKVSWKEEEKGGEK